MKAFDNILKLANKFQKKYAEEKPIVSQEGTTELFFGNESNQRTFAAKAQDPNGPVYKLLLQYYNKSQKPCSFFLKVNATPNVSANWIFATNPTLLNKAIWGALNGIFQSIMKESMESRQQKANSKAKLGSGSGELQIAELDWRY